MKLILNPMPNKIPQGLLLSPEDFYLLEICSWFVSVKGYVYGCATDEREPSGNKKRSLIHRLVLKNTLGRDLETHEQVDHINQNKLDNQRSNLRLASNQENHRNKGKNANNQSGFKGVYWAKNAGKWRAQVTVDGRRIHLGYYTSSQDAHKAYVDYVLKIDPVFYRVF